MGSRMMHLIIANRIADHLLLEDRSAFLLGGVAPDAVSPKDVSHFFAGEIQLHTRHIDYRAFLRKYRSQADHPYIQGYYTHLIADHIWLTGFYLPWLRNRMEEDHQLFQSYYNDFRILNGQLLEHYGKRDELMKGLSDRSNIVEIAEVKAEDVESFIPYVLEDMEYDSDIIYERLRVFTLNQIIGYIETSVEVGLKYMKSAVAVR